MIIELKENLNYLVKAYILIKNIKKVRIALRRKKQILGIKPMEQ